MKEPTMESPSRHGLSTVLALITASLTAVAPIIGDLAGAAEPLGVPPTIWVAISALMASLLVLSKAAQAVSTIWKQGGTTVLDAPEPDLNIPEFGDPDITTTTNVTGATTG